VYDSSKWAMETKLGNTLRMDQRGEFCTSLTLRSSLPRSSPSTPFLQPDSCNSRSPWDERCGERFTISRAQSFPRRRLIVVPERNTGRSAWSGSDTGRLGRDHRMSVPKQRASIIEEICRIQCSNSCCMETVSLNG
jgi:hypothetical protein